MSRIILLAAVLALLPTTAFAYINAGFRSQREYDEYLRNKKLKEIARGTEAIRRDPKDPVAHFYRGRIYLDQLKAESALPDFDKAIELNPRFAQAYLHRAKALLWLQEKGRAIADLEKATELNPKLAEAQVHLAVFTEDRETAIKAAKAACEAKDYEEEICVQLLAWAYARNGKFEQAVPNQILIAVVAKLPL